MVHLPNAPQKREVLELSEDQVVVLDSETLDCLKACRHLMKEIRWWQKIVITGQPQESVKRLRAYLEQGRGCRSNRTTDMNRLEILKSEFAVSTKSKPIWTFPLDVMNGHGEKTVCSDTRNDEED